MSVPPYGLCLKLSDDSTCSASSTNSMHRFHMLQHYRTTQRRYLQWRSKQEENQEDPSYYPPHLRQLRSDWFEKRYTKYRSETARQEPVASPLLWSQSSGGTSSGVEESEELAEKIARWLKCFEEESEDEPRGRSLRREDR